MSNKPYLHCGGIHASHNDVCLVQTPASTQTHVPIEHNVFVDEVNDALVESGLTITDTNYGLNHEGNDLFALFQVEKTNEAGNTLFQNVVGLRNSHIKHFSAGLVAGSRVFVCDNLAFSGEIKMNRKHTAHIMRDLPNLVRHMVSQLNDKWKFQEMRYSAYEATPVDQEQAIEVIGETVWENILPGSKFTAVRDEYLNPSHEEFEPRNAWSLFNAFTEVAKSSPRQLPERTIGFHTIMDKFAQEELDRLENEMAPLVLDNVVDAEIIERDPLTGAQLRDVYPADYNND
ncbi:MAG: DUF932 domain-containing protein [Aestuariivita sp.]|nr:DUF932 domain-containing protein [Aestuariivita sp.]